MKISVKTISHYLLLVGLPLLGVLSALWVGSSLVAPASVGGMWVLDIPEQPALSCQAFAGWESVTQAAISQSGTDLLIVFNLPAHTALTGNLSGLSIKAETTDAAMPVIQLRADVNRQADPHQLGGSLQAEGCLHALDFTGELLPTSQEP